jgi:hypothetical protein
MEERVEFEIEWRNRAISIAESINQFIDFLVLLLPFVDGDKSLSIHISSRKDFKVKWSDISNVRLEISEILFKMIKNGLKNDKGLIESLTKQKIDLGNISDSLKEPLLGFGFSAWSEDVGVSITVGCEDINHIKFDFYKYKPQLDYKLLVNLLINFSNPDVIFVIRNPMNVIRYSPVLTGWISFYNHKLSIVPKIQSKVQGKDTLLDKIRSSISGKDMDFTQLEVENNDKGIIVTVKTDAEDNTMRLLEKVVLFNQYIESIGFKY